MEPEILNEARFWQEIRFFTGHALTGLLTHGVPEGKEARAALIDMAIRIGRETTERFDTLRNKDVGDDNAAK